MRDEEGRPLPDLIPHSSSLIPRPSSRGTHRTSLISFSLPDPTPAGGLLDRARTSSASVAEYPRRGVALFTDPGGREGRFASDAGVRLSCPGRGPVGPV